MWLCEFALSHKYDALSKGQTLAILMLIIS